MRARALISAILTLTLCGCQVLPQTEASVTQFTFPGIESSHSGELPEESGTFDLSEIPEFSGSPSVEVNGNFPYFTKSEIRREPFEYYSELDSLGRCGVTFSCVCQETMPTEKRGSIGAVKPTGWHYDKYDFVDGKYLYNRCHLQGYQLTGENANERNLITGTRWSNTEGMLPYENEVASYVHRTGGHVLYRVTPIFSGEELLARGVLMEAYSVEDSGEGVCFCVFCYNAYPGVHIDYATGDNWLADRSLVQTDPEEQVTAAEESYSPPDDCDFVLNTSSMKIHLPDCDSVQKISEKNRQEYSGSYEELIGEGYSPCGACHPERTVTRD
ncbi:MAG: DNA/RNA non-specific endonuclease [Ruminococcus sp.]|nr:DNA/RNA non-specific endonuclease [Ruminococcus sp.]